MNKAELIAKLADDAGLTKTQAGAALDSFTEAVATTLKKGDKVSGRRIGNQAWIKELGEDSATVGRNRWKPFDINYDRMIVDVKGNTITIDAPIFCAIETR